MNHLRNKVLSLRKEIGITWESWAEQSNRSVETLKKQLSEDSNPTLSTMVGIAAPLHASVEILTEEELAELAQAKLMKERIAELEAEIKDYRTAVDVKNAQIENLIRSGEQDRDLIDRLRKGLTAKEESIQHKDKALAAKDEVIVGLLKKGGVL